MSEIEDIYDLSPLQQGVLYHSLASADPGAYLVTLAYHLEGALDGDALGRAWQRVAQRNPILRTSLHWEGIERPVQAVHPEAALVVARLDWHALDAAAQEEKAAAFVAEEQRTPFDLGEAPLARVALAACGEGEHRLFWTFHHAILEGWSASLLLEEVFAFYRAFAAGEELERPARPPYRDYILWLQRQDPAAAAAFWRDSLAGFSEPTAIPGLLTGRPAAERGRDYGRTVFPLALETSRALEVLARSQRVAVNTVLQGAWALLLGRHADRDDVTFGSVVSGRQVDVAGAESMAGLFVNTLPARLALPTRAPVGEWLRGLQQAQTALRRFEHSALVDVQGVSDVPRGTRLFETLFTFENWSGDVSLHEAAPGLRVRDVRSAEGSTGYALAVEALRGMPYALALTWDRALFDAAAVERLAVRYERLIASMAAAPGAALASLAWLPEAEQEQMVAEGNATARPYPAERALGSLFTEQAQRTPSAVAVTYGTASLTYAELEERSNRLAHRLRALGVRLDAGVGLCVERSIDMIVGMLGIVKAGGAYVPLDPSYPAERLSFMIEDSGLKLVLAQEALAPSAVASVCFDRDRDAIAAEPAEPIESGATGQNLAYVIYTSGSTGTPKGVAVTHQAVSRLVLGTDYVQLTPEDRVAQASNASFDAATFEIWGALLNGAQLVGIGREVALAPRELSRTLQEHGITTLFQTTALFNQVATEAVTGFSGLKHLLFGGEAVDPERVRRALEVGRPQRLLHVYGPTEVTTFATWQLVESVESGASTVPIGRPLANTTAYVLDQGMNPVPAGVPGELYLGGPGLARGYLNQPALTAERFVPSPFGPDGARLYKTGDLVRRQDDGAIVFLGRRDHQVKLRGFRVELGEIEAALLRDPSVKDAIVIVREDHPGDRRLVAYLACGSATPDVAALRAGLKAALPEYMVPAAFVTLEALPLNPNGKLDRKALPAPEGRGAAAPALVPARTELEQAVAAIWREALHVDAVGLDDNFFDLGGHSITLLRVHSLLRERASDSVKIVDLFRYPTLRALVGFLDPSASAIAPRPDTTLARDIAPNEPIAIVGMAGRFPGAPDVDAFWRNLRDGVESITFFTPEELAAAGVPAETVADPRYVPARGVLEGAGLFDAAFFGYNAREAAMIDPQQRLFLETAWNALENAGYDAEQYPGRIGVYAGTGVNGYALRLAGSAHWRGAGGGLPALIASDKDFLTTRVSYKLNLHGPSLDIQSACSTSLVAIHVACRSLLGGECDMALAGGVSIAVPETAGYLYQEEGILSPDGHCRAFDLEARGTVGGSGVGVVVLKRLADALADGDTIAAVIRGSAINNDGARKVGYTAPGVPGQADAIARAQAAAGVDASEIDYVEAHGTGTTLGDPIEVQALRQVFGAGDERARPCVIGALKSNVGHLDSAAGVAGVIKTALALRHREIPPTVHFTSPNPALELGRTFEVRGQRSDWLASDRPRRAGVSSFGIGGTNAHVVLEEAPELAGALVAGRAWQLLPLSARTPAALTAAAARLAEHLERHPELPLADVAHTLQVGRRAFRERRAVVCRDRSEAIRALRAAGPGAQAGAPRVVFLFPGQGSQHVDMLRGLYRDEPGFREVVDRACETLRRALGFDLREVLYPSEGQEAAAAERLAQTAVTQPALFVVEYALARWWQAAGVLPEAMLGHSVGEYVAACLAEVFSEEDALALVAERGRLMEALPAGAMLAVALPEAEASALASSRLGLAAVNGPGQCVLSGTHEAVAAAEAALAARGVDTRRLRTSHAFHSPMMDGAVDPFRERVAGVARSAPRIPFVSNLSGTWITGDEAVSPDYWARHLRGSVRFGDGLRELASDGGRVLLEVGPGQTLGGLARAVAGDGARILASARGARETRDDVETLLTAAGRLWSAGAGLEWAAVHAGETRRRVALPTYPFERQRYWIDVETTAVPMDATPVGRQAAVADWFYRPTWRAASVLATAPELAATDPAWLLFADTSGLAERAAGRLRAAGRRAVLVSAGPRFERDGADRFQVRASETADVEALFRALHAEGVAPARIVHLWGVAARGEAAPGFESLVALAQALGARDATGPVSLCVVTTGMQEIAGEGLPSPERALVLGPIRVIPQEYPGVRCRSLDIEAAVAGTWSEAAVSALLAECATDDAEPVVAHRRGERWLQQFVPAPLAAGSAPRLRQGGTYLITGGMGGIGLALAGHLARRVNAKLVLVGRRSLAEAGDAPRRAVAALEAAGSEVLVVSADVADAASLGAAFEQAEARFGRIDGVVHAAGVAPGGLLQLKTLAQAGRVLAAKVDGTRRIHGLLAGRSADFLMLCSSLASVLGIPGQADYCAANAFEDAFARSVSGAPGPFVVSVNWDTWSESGMAATTQAPPEWRALAAAEGAGLSDAQGCEVFERALAQPLPQLVVSTVTLGPRLAAFRSLSAEAPAAPAAEARHARPELATGYVAPRDEVEATIAEIWQELLGFARVGVEDDFFDLGGHSLLAMQIVNRVRETFEVPLKLQALFDAPTVAALARVVIAAEAHPGQVLEIARLVGGIGGLSDAEVEERLKEGRAS